MKHALALSLLSLSCSGSSPAKTETPPPATDPPVEPQRLGEDTEITVGGVVFTAPAGWSVTRGENAVTLTAPEGDSQLSIATVNASDPDSAVVAGWSAIGRTPKYPVKLSQAVPGRDGFTTAQTIAYDVPPDAKVIVGATALKSAAGWSVLLFEASEPTFDKRRAAIGQIAGSLRPSGYAKEAFAGRKRHRLDAKRVALIEAFVEEARQKLDIPGVALALYDNGEMVSARGFGVRELGKKQKVDADTLFMVASNTKPLTTLMLASLVADGKFTWETPVIDRFGKFKLGDPETTKRVLFKHLVCACTGLPRQDLEWIFEFAKATPASALASLAKMTPTTKFGETFQYSNPLAAAAGFAGGHVAYPKLELGAAYDRAMQERVFDPLGMKTATFDYRKAQAGNHARPHGENPDGVTRVAAMDFNYAARPVRPAGALWASARDMMGYVRMELDRGKLPDGSRYMAEDVLLARREPQVRTGATTAYGMGLGIDTSWEIPILSHGGSMLGFKSNMFFFPDHGVGAVILTNSEAGGLLLGPFLRRLVEVMFDGRAEAVEDVASRAERRKKQFATERARLVIPPDASEVAKLASRYSSPDLGQLAIKKGKDAVIFDFGEWRTAVASKKAENGTVAFVSIDPGYLGFEFVVATRDGKRVLTTRSMQHEYVFTE